MSPEERPHGIELAPACFDLAGRQEKFMGVPVNLLMATIASLRLSKWFYSDKTSFIPDGEKYGIEEAIVLQNAYLMRTIADQYDKEIPEVFEICQYYYNSTVKNRNKKGGRKNDEAGE